MKEVDFITLQLWNILNSSLMINLTWCRLKKVKSGGSMKEEELVNLLEGATEVSDTLKVHLQSSLKQGRIIHKSGKLV